MAQPIDFTIQAGDGSTDTITLPEGFTDLFGEDTDSAASVVGDITLLATAQQVHGVIHHSPEEATDEVEAIESAVLEEFESRFGQSFGDMTGHSH